MSGSTAVCADTSEAVELFKPQGLYLKPIGKLNVSVQLPQIKQAGKTISNWEVMEKVKNMVKPHIFLTVKVVKSTLEFIRLEGEAENKALVKTMIQRLEGKTIKLSGFPDTLKVKAAEAKVNFPTRHGWDSYFRDAKNMNEMKPGERPDTLHLKDLPTKWFTTRHSRDTDEPNEQVLRRIFEGFGEVRCVDIPMLDPYRKEMTFGKKSLQTFTFGQQGLTFEAFVQYKEYIGFVKAMDALRGMKMLYMPEEEEGKAYASYIKVDFDKTKHLSDRSIKKRRIEREKLMELEREREEKVRREREEEARKQEEERRKKEEEEQEKERKRLEKIQKREERRKDRELKRKERREERKKREEERLYQLKIDTEERKFLIAQRKLESIRLLTELFNRVRAIKVRDDLVLREKELELEKQRQVELEKQQKEEEKRKKKEQKMKKKLELKKQEHELRHKILRNFKIREEQKEEEMREKLREKLAGTSKVKSAVIMKKKLKEVIGERDQSMNLQGYGTMSNWDQSLMDERYRQWAMAFYNYWYQRYAVLGFYKPKAMGFYKPKGYGRGFNKGFDKGFNKSSPHKFYNQGGGRGFFKPGTKEYFNMGSKRFGKYSQGFQYYKNDRRSYYEHDSRDGYDSSRYDYKSRDDRYEYSDYSEDSDYYEKSSKSKRRKRKFEKSEDEFDVEKSKAKKSKGKEKASKKKVKKSKNKDELYSTKEKLYSDDPDSAETSDVHKKKKIAEKLYSDDPDSAETSDVHKKKKIAEKLYSDDPDSAETSDVHRKKKSAEKLYSDDPDSAETSDVHRKKKIAKRKKLKDSRSSIKKQDNVKFEDAVESEKSHIKDKEDVSNSKVTESKVKVKKKDSSKVEKKDRHIEGKETDNAVEQTKVEENLDMFADDKPDQSENVTVETEIAAVEESFSGNSKEKSDTKSSNLTPKVSKGKIAAKRLKANKSRTSSAKKKRNVQTVKKRLSKVSKESGNKMSSDVIGENVVSQPDKKDSVSSHSDHVAKVFDNVSDREVSVTENVDGANNTSNPEHVEDIFSQGNDVEVEIS